MNIEDLKDLGVAEEAAEKIIALYEEALSAEQKKLSDKEAELEMAAEKIGELSAENKKLSDKIAELSEEVSALNAENEQLLADKQLMEEGPRTVNMGLKHGMAASGDQFGFRFTGVRCAKNS